MTQDLQRGPFPAVHPRRLDFRLHAVIEEVITACSGLNRHNRLKLSFRIDEALPPTLRGDPGRLRQTLCDLLGHAIELTESGAVLLEVELAQATEWALVVRFHVIDSGCGRAQLVQAFSPASATQP